MISSWFFILERGEFIRLCGKMLSNEVGEGFNFFQLSVNAIATFPFYALSQHKHVQWQSLPGYIPCQRQVEIAWFQ